MPFDASPALRDIERHIDLATQFVAGMDHDAFRDGARTVYAVSRCLEIISEASRRLPDEMKARYPVQLALPPLRDGVAREIVAFE
jgi:uncharacterized protein with HEPN domain